MAAKKVLVGVQAIVLAVLIFVTMPIPSSSSSSTTMTTTPSSPAVAVAVDTYADLSAKNFSRHGTEDTSKEESDAIPRSFDAPFGSYPNLLKITNEERDSFSPVVFFSEPRGSGSSISYNNHVAVKDHRKSSGELASVEAIQRKRALKTKNYSGRFWNFSSRVLSSSLEKAMGLARGRFDSKIHLGDGNQVASQQQQQQQWAIGKYDENRDGGMYESDLFDDLENTIDGYGGRRTVHLGMDLGGPVGTPVHSFSDGIVHSVGYNPDLGDYGYVIVVEHFWGPGSGGEDGTKPKNNDIKRCWALYGHLDESTLTSTVAAEEGEDGNQFGNRWWTRLWPPRRKRTVLVKAGDFVRKGTILGRMGDIDGNGGWINSHLHFQLSTKPPDQPHDMPGASSVKDRLVALQQYPDPRYVLGPLYGSGETNQ